MFAVTFKNKKTRVNEIEKNIVFFVSSGENDTQS